MFDEIQFDRIKRLPKYVFAEVNDLKMAERRAGADVIDFSMGNPDGDTPEHIREKLLESAKKTKTHGYSNSKGIYKLRLAICDWYKRRYGVDLDPETEAVATMGSKEGYAHLAYAITNPGDVTVVPDPTYPIHSYAFIPFVRANLPATASAASATRSTPSTKALPIRSTLMHSYLPAAMYRRCRCRMMRITG